MNTTPVPATSRRRMDEIWAEHRAAFHAALAQEIADIPGLNADFEHSHVLAWLDWDGDGENGYWVDAGIAYHSHLPEDALPGHVTAAYIDTNDDGNENLLDSYILAIDTPPARARDAQTAAALAAAAVRIHGHRRGLPR